MVIGNSQSVIHQSRFTIHLSTVLPRQRCGLAGASYRISDAGYATSLNPTAAK
jgi:hypothetical protein